MSSKDMEISYNILDFFLEIFKNVKEIPWRNTLEEYLLKAWNHQCSV